MVDAARHNWRTGVLLVTAFLTMFAGAVIYIVTFK